MRHRDGGKDVRERLGPLGPDFGVEAARKVALAVLWGGQPAEKPRAIEALLGAPRRPQRHQLPLTRNTLSAGFARSPDSPSRPH